MENVAFNRNDLYDELAEMAREEGIADREAWNELIETLLADKMEFQEMDDDADTAQFRADLQARYDEYAGEIGVM